MRRVRPLTPRVLREIEKLAAILSQPPADPTDAKGKYGEIVARMAFDYAPLMLAHIKRYRDGKLPGV